MRLCRRCGMGCILSIGSIDRLINNPPTGPPHHRYDSPLCSYFSYLSRFKPLPAPPKKADAKKSNGKSKGKSTSNKDGGKPLCANAVDALIHHVVRAVAAAAPEVGGWVRIYRSCVSCHVIIYLCAGVFERFITVKPLREPRTFHLGGLFCCTHTETGGRPRHARGVVGAHAAARLGPCFALRHGRAGAAGGGCVVLCLLMWIGCVGRIMMCRLLGASSIHPTPPFHSHDNTQASSAPHSLAASSFSPTAATGTMTQPWWAARRWCWTSG